MCLRNEPLLSDSVRPAHWVNAHRVARALVLGLTLWLLRSFVVPLIWAIIVAVSSWPMYRRTARLFPDSLRAQWAPPLLAAVITLLVLGPIVFAFSILAEQMHDLTLQVALADQHGVVAPHWFTDVPLIGDRLAELWNSTAGAPGGLTALVSHADTGSTLRWVQSVGQLIAYHAFVAAVTVVVLFSLFRQGESLAVLLARGVGRRFGRAGTAYLGLAIAALRATVSSLVVIGLADGILLGLAYAAVHVPSPAAWGALTGLAAMLPFVGYVAVAAVCIGLLVRGAAASAVLIGGIGLAVLFTNDKFVRPTLMAGRARINFLGALMGTLGGLQTFGLLGVFIGPVIIALGEAVCREWLNDRKAAGGQLSHLPPG
jgi:predicted PurR-regulated permease PerM